MIVCDGCDARNITKSNVEICGHEMSLRLHLCAACWKEFHATAKAWKADTVGRKVAKAKQKRAADERKRKAAVQREAAAQIGNVNAVAYGISTRGKYINCPLCDTSQCFRHQNAEDLHDLLELQQKTGTAFTRYDLIVKARQMMADYGAVCQQRKTKMKRNKVMTTI